MKMLLFSMVIAAAAMTSCQKNVKDLAPDQSVSNPDENTTITLLETKSALRYECHKSNTSGFVVKFTAQNEGRDTTSHEDSTVMLTKLSYLWSSTNSKIRSMDIILDGEYLKTLPVTKDEQFESIPSSVHAGWHDMKFLGKDILGRTVAVIDFPYEVSLQP